MTHGTITAYTTRHCRCAECRVAWAAYHRERRARRQAERLQRLEPGSQETSLALEQRKFESWAAHDAWGRKVVANRITSV